MFYELEPLIEQTVPPFAMKRKIIVFILIRHQLFEQTLLIGLHKINVGTQIVQLKTVPHTFVYVMLCYVLLCLMCCNNTANDVEKYIEFLTFRYWQQQIQGPRLDIMEIPL